jgi:hypothetical protein
MRLEFGRGMNIGVPPAGKVRILICRRPIRLPSQVSRAGASPSGAALCYMSVTLGGSRNGDAAEPKDANSGLRAG